MYVNNKLEQLNCVHASTGPPCPHIY